MARDLSDEFRLLVACCRWPATPEAVLSAATAPIDWETFLTLVGRHRVPVLAFKGLNRAGIDVPASIREALSSYASAARHKSLIAARENLRVQRLLDEAGIPNISFKGPSVAMLAYGDPGIKFSHDVDILTPPDQVERTFKVLEEAGFGMCPIPEVNITRPQGSALSLLVTLRSEQPFFDRRTNTHVDIHWRMFANRCLLPTFTAAMKTQAVELGGEVIRTLPDDDLFIYLAVHGAIHGWSRLKWVADVAAFLGGRDDVEHLYLAAARTGVGQAAGVALILCEQLFGMLFPALLMQRVRGDRPAARLAALSLECLTIGEKDTIELGRRQWALMATAFGLAPGLRYRWAEFEMRCSSFNDRVNLPLPKVLSFLYLFLRVPMWLARRRKRRMAQPAS